jgi:hypothetical protein
VVGNRARLSADDNGNTSKRAHVPGTRAADAVHGKLNGSGSADGRAKRNARKNRERSDALAGRPARRTSHGRFLDE